MLDTIRVGCVVGPAHSMFFFDRGCLPSRCFGLLWGLLTLLGGGVVSIFVRVVVLSCTGMRIVVVCFRVLLLRFFCLLCPGLYHIINSGSLLGACPPVQARRMAQDRRGPADSHPRPRGWETLSFPPHAPGARYKPGTGS